MTGFRVISGGRLVKLAGRPEQVEHVIPGPLPVAADRQRRRRLDFGEERFRVGGGQPEPVGQHHLGPAGGDVPAAVPGGVVHRLHRQERPGGRQLPAENRVPLGVPAECAVEVLPAALRHVGRDGRRVRPLRRVAGVPHRLGDGGLGGRGGGQLLGRAGGGERARQFGVGDDVQPAPPLGLGQFVRVGDAAVRQLHEVTDLGPGQVAGTKVVRRVRHPPPQPVLPVGVFRLGQQLPHLRLGHRQPAGLAALLDGLQPPPEPGRQHPAGQLGVRLGQPVAGGFGLGRHRLVAGRRGRLFQPGHLGGQPVPDRPQIGVGHVRIPVACQRPLGLGQSAAGVRLQLVQPASQLGGRLRLGVV